MYHLTNYEKNLIELGVRVCLHLKRAFDHESILSAIRMCHQRYGALNGVFEEREGQWYLLEEGHHPDAGVRLEFVEAEPTQSEFEAASAREGYGNNRVVHYRYVRSPSQDRSSLQLFGSHSVVNLRSAFTILETILRCLMDPLLTLPPSESASWIHVEKALDPLKPTGLFYSFENPETVVFPVHFEQVEDLSASSVVSYHSRIPRDDLERILARLKRDGARFQSLLWLALYLAYRELKGEDKSCRRHLLLEAPVDYIGKLDFKVPVSADSLIGAVGLLYIPVDIDPGESLGSVVNRVSETLKSELASGRQLRETVAIFTPSDLITLPEPTILSSTLNRINLPSELVDDVSMLSLYYPLQILRNYTFHGYTLQDGDFLLNSSFLNPAYPRDFMTRWIDQTIEYMIAYPKDVAKPLGEF